MARINSHYDKLAAAYPFPEIARHTKAFWEANSRIQVLRLGNDAFLNRHRHEAVKSCKP